MARDPDFLDAMRGLGVQPLDGPAPEPAAPRRTDRADEVSPEDRALFLASVERVGAADDKDAVRAPGAGARDETIVPAPAADHKPRLANLPPRTAPDAVDAELDLHRERQEPALERLRAFLVRSAIAGHARVLVITGKGHHSGAGRGVLRRAVETWLIRHGGPWVARYAVAPRTLGGRGAWVLELHR